MAVMTLPSTVLPRINGCVIVTSGSDCAGTVTGRVAELENFAWQHYNLLPSAPAGPRHNTP